MDLYTNFVSKVLFPFHEHLKKHDSVKLRKRLEKSQWLDKDELRQLQLDKLRSFMVSVEKKVPYYQQLFNKHKFNPQKILSQADLAQLPILEKSEIRTHTDQFKATDATSLTKYNTGGSSGEPLIFYIGRNRVSHDVAAKWRATRWWDVDIGDPEIVIWGSPVELGAQDKVRLIRDKVMRSHLVPAFEMSEHNLDNFIGKIQSIRPKMLFGYPSALTLIAQHAEKKNKILNNLGIEVAFVTSERLYDHQREKIEAIFNCPVANGYGGRDAGFIAHQCPSGGMHISAEDIIVEIIDKKGKLLPNGKAGEIVVTHLGTEDFPFIRYRTGDVGVLTDDKCPCGRGLPLLKEIQGRTTDFVVAQDGTVLHGLSLIYVLRDLQGVSEFKIIQENLHETTVQIVKNENYRPEFEGKIKAEFKKRLGQDVAISIVFCDEIAKEKSGKFRYVISNISV